MTDILELISSRKSVRKYLDKHIPDEDLRKILEAGRLAPSWMNVQCWKFILVKNQETKDLLSELSIGQPQVKNADALIVCVADTQDWENAKITHIQKPALNPALQCENGILIRSLEQVIYPVSYMMLEAHSLGVSSCIIGAFGSEITTILPEVSAKAKQVLNLNEHQIISTIITLGYDAENKETVKVRKNFDDVVAFEKLS
ncbi:MAG: nitroreductase family protein [Candidatus Gastranaerophilales bacterium]|nr:nitroreductase family protein [Candidatus Gastranaerophilales bacterium]MCM1073059.1 nitroreductase family protein [Bacteroides sp.]